MTSAPDVATRLRGEEAVSLNVLLLEHTWSRMQYERAVLDLDMLKATLRVRRQQAATYAQEVEHLAEGLARIHHHDVRRELQLGCCWCFADVGPAGDPVGVVEDAGVRKAPAAAERPA